MLVQFLANTITILFIVGALYFVFRAGILLLSSIKFWYDLFRASYMGISVQTWIRNPHMRKGILNNAVKRGTGEEFKNGILATHIQETERKDLNV